jgi:glutamate decarboxylase
MSGMTTSHDAARSGESTHGFTGISDQNQLNPLFARPGEATDFPLNALPPGESLPETGLPGRA